MRWGALLILCVGVIGCQKTQKPVAAAPLATTAPAAATQPAPRAASALAFAAPIAQGQPEIQLWRDGREVTAFGGYDQPIAQYYYIRTDDRQNIWGDNDTVMRRAVNVRIGITTR